MSRSLQGGVNGGVLMMTSGRGSGEALEKRIQGMAGRLFDLRESAEAHEQVPRSFVLEAVDDLADTLEELDVATSMLQNVNQELAEARTRSDRDRRRYRFLFDHAPHGYVTTDLDGLIVEANRAAASILTPDTDHRPVVGRTFHTLVAERDRPRVLRTLRAFEDDDPGIVDAHRVALVSERVARVSASVVWAEDASRQICWQFVDVTALEQAEARTERAEARYRALVEQVPAISYVRRVGVGVQEGFLYISPQVETILGYSQDEWHESPRLWVERIHPADRPRVLAEYARHINDGDPFVAEYRLLDRDDETHWFRVEATLRRDPETDDLVSQGVALEITERKRAEEQLGSLAEEQTVLIEREQREIERLQRLDEVKNLFLQALSHELRKPLGAILGLAMTLDRQDVDLSQEERQQLHGRLEHNARRCTRLLTDLLDLKRLTSHVVSIDRIPTDLASLVDKTIDELDDRDGARVNAYTQEGLTVSVEPAMIQRILENLIENAIRHTPAGTPVEVRTERTGDEALIEVADRGQGVPDELKGRIFEPFERGDATGPGSGLGLAIVREFAELHGGRASVEDRPGGGSRFQVRLPVHPSVA